MSGFAFQITDGEATRVGVKEALDCTADLVWVHLSTTAEHAQAWLRDEAKLLDYVVDALTATETRPRCEAVGDGAFVNLRGRSKEELDTSDLLASVRIWAVKGRVYSVTRKPLIAVAEVEKMVERGEIRGAVERFLDIDARRFAVGDAKSEAAHRAISIATERPVPGSAGIAAQRRAASARARSSIAAGTSGL